MVEFRHQMKGLRSPAEQAQTTSIEVAAGEAELVQDDDTDPMKQLKLTIKSKERKKYDARAKELKRVHEDLAKTAAADYVKVLGQ